MPDKEWEKLPDEEKREKLVEALRKRQEEDAQPKRNYSVSELLAEEILLSIERATVHPVLDSVIDNQLGNKPPDQWDDVGMLVFIIIFLFFFPPPPDFAVHAFFESLPRSNWGSIEAHQLPLNAIFSPRLSAEQRNELSSFFESLGRATDLAHRLVINCASVLANLNIDRQLYKVVEGKDPDEKDPVKLLQFLDGWIRTKKPGDLEETFRRSPEKFASCVPEDDKLIDWLWKICRCVTTVQRAKKYNKNEGEFAAESLIIAHILETAGVKVEDLPDRSNMNSPFLFQKAFLLSLLTTAQRFTPSSSSKS
jgi:hypothetical protein